MKTIRLLASLLILFLIASCSTPKKKFDKGKYDQAFDLALKNLEKGKAERGDKSILNKSYRELVSSTNEQADLMIRSRHTDQWELTYALYTALIEKYKKADKYLHSEQAELNDQMIADKQNLEDRLVDTLLQLGDYNLDYAKKDNKKWLAQYAHEQYKKTQYYQQVPGIDTLLQQCIEYGTYIYLVDASADFASKYKWEIDRRFDDLESEQLEFINIFYDRYVNNADCDFEIRFRNLEFETREDAKTNQYTKKILDGYNTTVDSSGNEIKTAIYKDVEAQVIERKLSKIASWECAMDAKAVTHNCRKRDKYFNRSYTSSIMRYDISGDERAVPDKYRNNVMENFEDEDDMAEELIELIYRDVLEYLSKLE